MNVRRGGLRYPRTVAYDVPGRRYKLAHFVPERGEPQIRPVQHEHCACKDEEEKQVRSSRN
jgi:hypothetical protein